MEVRKQKMHYSFLKLSVLKYFIYIYILYSNKNKTVFKIFQKGIIWMLKLLLHGTHENKQFFLVPLVDLLIGMEDMKISTVL